MVTAASDLAPLRPARYADSRRSNLRAKGGDGFTQLGPAAASTRSC